MAAAASPDHRRHQQQQQQQQQQQSGGDGEDGGVAGQLRMILLEVLPGARVPSLPPGLLLELARRCPEMGSELVARLAAAAVTMTRRPDGGIADDGRSSVDAFAARELLLQLIAQQA